MKSLENVITASREKEFYENKLQEEGMIELERKSEELTKIEKDRSVVSSNI